MKKLTLMLSVKLLAGATFACDGDKKGSAKACCKKEATAANKKACCSKDEKKSCNKGTAAKEDVKPATTAEKAPEKKS